MKNSYTQLNYYSRYKYRHLWQKKKKKRQNKGIFRQERLREFITHNFSWKELLKGKGKGRNKIQEAVAFKAIGKFI